jgi:hypothetical protein
LDVYQVTLTCAECRSETKAILSNAATEAICSACGAKVLKAKRFAGVVYVMAHPKVSGVKIGMTQHDVFKRAKQISGTGVPGHFQVLAAFPSSNPLRDERKVHEKLSRAHIAKEHFELDPVVAVTRVRSILNREPAYVERSIEDAVLKLREEQREKALGRFAKPAGASNSDMSASGECADLSSQPDEKTPVDQRETTSKGFFSNLFSS